MAVTDCDATRPRNFRKVPDRVPDADLRHMGNDYATFAVTEAACSRRGLQCATMGKPTSFISKNVTVRADQLDVSRVAREELQTISAQIVGPAP